MSVSKEEDYSLDACLESWNQINGFDVSSNSGINPKEMSNFMCCNDGMRRTVFLGLNFRLTLHQIDH